jgi:hypothetical protein
MPNTDYTDNASVFSPDARVLFSQGHNKITFKSKSNHSENISLNQNQINFWKVSLTQLKLKTSRFEMQDKDCSCKIGTVIARSEIQTPKIHQYELFICTFFMFYVLGTLVSYFMDLWSWGRSTKVTTPEVYEGMVYKQKKNPGSKEDVKLCTHKKY